MQQLATNLVLLLEKQALQAVQTDLLNRQGRQGGSGHEGSTENELSNIKLDDLALSVLLNMNALPIDSSRRTLEHMYTHTNAFYVQILAILAAFNAVDVDNRGVVSFTDFTNFCLRVGRLLLKPSVKHVMKNYLLSQDTKSTLYPSDKMRYISQTNLLLVFDADAPRVRVYSKDIYLSRINPVLAAKKALHVSVQAKLTYYEKMALEKQATQIRITEKELEETKGTVLDVCFADSVKQYIFTTSHSYLIFVDGSISLYDDKGEMRIVGHVKTGFPMHTLYYSKVLDLVLAIPGEGSDHVVEMYDPRMRKMKFKVSKHDSKVLSLCEVILDKIHPMKDHYFASSSMDGKLILWPSAPLSAMMSKLHTQRLLRMAETVDYDLKGHHHAIHSLVYAHHQEIIIGAGYDFEILAWDPFTRDMCMKFAGHFKSIAGIQMVYIPEERLMSLDETGMVKLWNVSKELGIYGTQEHSFQLHCQQPAHIRWLSKTYGEGKGIAVLAEKLYFLNLENDYADDLKPILFGICPTLGRLFTVCRSSIHLIDILSSRVAKSLTFLDPDRVSSTDQIMSRNDEMRTQSSTAQPEALKGLNIKTKTAGYIDIKDTVTACAVDSMGKKVFIGTLDGRVLMFDSYTFGLLKQLTDEDEDGAFRFQGAVAGLQYVDRDELVVAVYAAGAVKIFGGSLRHAYAGPKHSIHRPQRGKKGASTGGMGDSKAKEEEEDFIPHSTGGKPPIRPFLLRECDLGVLPDFSVRALAVSEVHNLIAVLTKQGVIYFYDYLNLSFVACIALEDEFESAAKTAATDTVKQYISMKFLPFLPILVVADSGNTVFTWTVRPMAFKHLLSWNVYQDIKFENSLKEVFDNLNWNGETELTLTNSERASPVPHTAITSMRCFSFSTSTQRDKKLHVERHWLLLLGTDYGQVIMLNVSDLVHRSGAMEYIPRADAFYLTYHKMKPKRYFDPNSGIASTAIPRARIPEELVPKLVPIREDIDLFFAADGTQSKTGSPPSKLSRQQTKKMKREQKKHKLDGKPDEYVQGLEVWQAFYQAAVRDWEYYDPFYNHITDKPNAKAFGSHHQTYVPDCGQVMDRLPLLFVVSDQGQVRCLSFTGMHLGDSLEELNSNSSNPKSKPANSSQPTAPLTSSKKQSEESVVQQDKALGESKQAAEGQEGDSALCSTFITSVMTDLSLDGVPTNDQDESSSMGPTATIYVKNSKRQLLVPRKVSIQPKASAFDFSSSVIKKSSVASVTPGAVAFRTPTTRRVNDASISTTSPLLEEPTVENMHLNSFTAPYLTTAGTVSSYAAYTSSSQFANKYAWSLPQVSIYLPQLLEGRDQNKDVLSVDQVTKLTYTQYTYYKDILGRLLPAVEAEINARFRARFESFSADPEAYYANNPKAQFSKQSSTYMTRFASAENLLQGLNSFLIDRRADEIKSSSVDQTAATVITTMHKQNITRESVLEKIILTMSDREVMIAEMLKEQNKVKWERKNLTHLIDYIQHSDSFGEEIKSAPSHFATFKNYEKEKNRGKRAPWEQHSERTTLNFAELKKEYFPELEKKKKSSVDVTSASGEGEAKLGLSVQYREINLSSSKVIAKEMLPAKEEDDVATPMKSSSPLPIRNMDPFPFAHSIDSTEEILQKSLENVPHVFSPAPLDPALPPLARPHTAPSSKPPLQPKPRLFSPTPQPLRNSSSHASVRPHSALTRTSPQSPAPQTLSPRPLSPLVSPPQSAQSIRHHNTMDSLIERLEDVAVDAQRKKVGRKTRSRGSKRTEGGELARPKTAQARLQSDPDDVVADKEKEVVREEVILINGASTQRAFSANKERVDEIYQKFDDIMLTLKSGVSNYQHYDPLRQKRLMELAKHKRKLQLRLKATQEGNNYVEDERFEGIVDMEKEAKKQESKHMLAQSRATGRKNGYGLYKYIDLIKFIHFVNLLQELDVPVHERNAMYFYDEVGTDISKYVRDQPYYLVNEVLYFVDSLFGQSEHVNVLKESLAFFRDEVPKSQRISLYQLVGVIFVMSKAWGVQLRIYMFVTAAHMIYRLMRGALPPKDQREQHRRRLDGADEESDGDQIEEGQISPGTVSPPPELLTSPVPTPSKMRSQLHNVIAQHRRLSISSMSGAGEDEGGEGEGEGESMPFSPFDDLGEGGYISSPNLVDVIEDDAAIDNKIDGGVKPETRPISAKDSPMLEKEGEKKIALAADAGTSAPPAGPQAQTAKPLELADHQFFHDVSEDTVLKFVVRPHPMRGFRQWIVRRKAFNNVTRVLNFWCDGSMECLTINDMVEIVHSLVPRHALDKFRIMRILPVAVHRMGMMLSQELSGQVLTKIFHTALEIKVVSD